MVTQIIYPSSPEFQQAIINCADMAIIVTDRNGMVCTFNRAAENLLGYTASEAIDHIHWTEFHHQDHRNTSHSDQQQQLHQTLIERVILGETDEQQHTYIRRDGTTLPVSVLISGVRDENGQLMGFLAMVRPLPQAAIDTQKQRQQFLRKQQQAQMQLARSWEFYHGDIDQAFETLTAIAAQTLQVSRASIWFYTEYHNGIECVKLYEQEKNCYSQGIKLEAIDYPRYFAAIETEERIVAFDAQNDPRTREFTAAYLQPLDIRSMLDIPIRLGGETIGVLCLENQGEVIDWDLQQQNFATYLADWVTLTLEAHERAIAQKALHQSQKQLQDILDHAPAIIYMKDNSGRYLLVNREYEKRFNLHRDQVLGKTDYDLFTPDIALAFQSADTALLESEKPIQWEEEIRFNNTFKTYLSHRFLLEDDTGKPAAICCLATDITNHKRSEAALRESEATNRALLNAIPDLILQCQGDGTIVDVKPPHDSSDWMLPELLVGRNILEILPNEVGNHLQNAHNRALFSSEIQAIEYKLPANNGEDWRQYETRIVSGNSQTVISIIRDITEQKRATTELARRVQLTALKSEVGFAMTRGGSLSEVLTNCANTLSAYLDDTIACIWTLNSAKTLLELQGISGLENPPANLAYIKVGYQPIGVIVSEQQSILSLDLSHHGWSQDFAIITERGFTNFVGYPLIVEGACVGVIGLFSRELLSKQVLETLAVIANQMAVGIEFKKAVVALQSREEQLELALEGSALGLWDWNISTGEVYFDPQWQRMLGYDEHQIDNSFQSWKQLIHPHDQKRVVEALNDSVKGRRHVYEVEVRMLNSSQQWQWMLYRGKVFTWDEQGRPLRMTGTYKDVSDRKQAEIELLRVKAAVDSSSDAIVMTDLEGKALYLNRALIESYGYTVQELNAIGGPIKLYISTRVGNSILASLQNLRSWSGEVGIKTRSGVIIPNLVRADCIFDPTQNPIGLIIVHTDITERRRAEETLQQKLLQERFVGIMLERIRSSLNLQEVLQTAVEEVRYFLQVDRTVIYKFNSDFTGSIAVESVGAEWMALQGLDIRDDCFESSHARLYEDGRTRAIADIYNANLTACHVGLLEGLQVKANLVIPILQPKNVAKDNSKLWGLLIAHQCRDTRKWQAFEISSLKQIGVQLAIALQQCSLFEQVQMELAERKQAEEALQRSEGRERRKAKQLSTTLQELKSTQAQIIQSEKMASLGQLVAGVAHEINNPISFIYGNVNPARQYLADLLDLCELYQQVYPETHPAIQDKIEEIDLEFIKEDFGQILESMQRGAERVTKIVLSLRNFARLDEAKIKKANINESIENTLMMLQGRFNMVAKKRPIKVVKNWGDVPKIECFASEINQVFLNLLNNAIDALEDRIKVHRDFIPTLTVTTLPVHHPKSGNVGVKIEIADNGLGIPQEIQSKIFDPFFTTKSVGRGTGLGLSIAHKTIVEQHGGYLECDSQENVGTTMIIRLFNNYLDQRMSKVE
ncbi:PAS domain S-box protein [Arthrospira platensis NCB002]|uniref:PAS domain S-box protein n=1 Tax=Limnospira platensis TaxID=118562 RepID=UPI0001D0E663|nr:PAS domain S-box protein [Arthrospira platensis NCB002]BAI90639.1 two-component hybrid sensor and regulator [Arthrospira platensis NIES-39]BDT12937.1 two-component hybrid sensor and regulator [Arthrospira platensis NIES-39]